MADENNPFEDEDVQAAANSDGGPPPAPQNYGGDAYDDGNENAAMNVAVDMAKYIPPDAQKELAIAAGGAVANQAVDAAKDDYNKSSAHSADQHEAPPPPSFCVNLFNWFPLRLFSFIGGMLLIVGPILDMILPFTGAGGFIEFFIFIYAIGFGVVTVFIESPTWKLTRTLQLKFFFWFRLLSRMWGRAWFYLFVSILCYACLDGTSSGQDGPVFTIVAGVYLTIISVLSFFFSKLAAKKYVRIYTYIAAGTEGDELIGKFMRKFDELDLDSDGKIGSVEIVKLAEMSSRVLSNSERHAIQTFLDESCNGYVSKEDWMKMWMLYNVKQHFL